jgi:DNA-binding NarL/FixJ family response regulator
VIPTTSIIAGARAAWRPPQPHHCPQPVFASDSDLGATKRYEASDRILIAEDDFLVASEMEAALAQAGFEVVGVASSADQALELAAAELPTLVVMDVRLSGTRDGIDAALELFATHGIRCVFATAHQTAETRTRAQPANPLRWLAKPYTMLSLVDTVRRALQELQPRAS